jgi:isopentenyl phosphate kinase
MRILEYMNNLTIIKIGGAVLTDKKGSGALRKKTIAGLAKQINMARGKQSGPLILVFGVGGKIHAAAKKYGLDRAIVTRGQISNAVKIHMMAKTLQMEVTASFLKLNPVVPLQTNNFFFINRAGTPIIKNLDFILVLLRQGYIPVLYGDMVYHPAKNFVILSGDKISICLAKALKASQVIFATDVDGIYIDPKKIGQKQELIKTVSIQQLKRLLTKYGSYKAKDSTGDLPGKLREILLKPNYTKVLILNGLKQKNIFRALTEKSMPGTIIT